MFECTYSTVALWPRWQQRKKQNDACVIIFGWPIFRSDLLRFVLAKITPDSVRTSTVSGIENWMTAFLCDSVRTSTESESGRTKRQTL
jgi:hypothetical protein